MIDLRKYRDYWEGVAKRVPGITGALPVTVDDEMAKKIMNLPKGSVTLFYLPPSAQTGPGVFDPDSFREDSLGVVFVMERYDPQRRTAFEVLETSQRAIEMVKHCLIGDTLGGCPVMRVDVSSLNTLPETRFYAGFAGWSLGFSLKG